MGQPETKDIETGTIHGYWECQADGRQGDISYRSTLRVSTRISWCPRDLYLDQKMTQTPVPRSQDDADTCT
ncbi:hypothetical protein RRG08_040516 [Elysia crispata]|uniref:Uncharacterized protein n=1 Tax=Elysia crispata TaxID=231223 RepID=A0AAE0Z682_9GAST|nr:hypothetical protein RRG08_040516 [Elysia crispata]